MTKAIGRATTALICAVIIGLSFSTSTIAAGPAIVTEAQNGKTIAIDQGNPLVVSLESNPSTGYSWQVGKNDNSILKFVDQSAFPPTVHMPGAPGHQMFKFKAIAAGTDSLELEYIRPWEKGVAPAKRFNVRVTVK